MPLRLFNLGDLRDLSLDEQQPLYLYNGKKYVRHKFERVDIDSLYDLTTKRSYPINILHKGEWVHIDDTQDLKLNDYDPVGYGVLLYVRE